METIIIAGGSGLVGTRLTTILEEIGYSVLILTRNEEKASSDSKFIHWNIDKNQVDKRIQEVDHIINLCGSGIADKRWTKSRKRNILRSRIDPIRLLLNEIKVRKKTLQSFISASAIGYYGDGGEKLLTEDSPPQTKEFLSDVCIAWEEEALKIRSYVQHFSIIRIGTVLSANGGALEKMALTIPYGVANYMGSGNQIMSWIHIDDLCGIILHLIQQESEGIFNTVSPQNMPNKAFTKVLKSVINPKAILLPAPALGLKLALGELSKVILNSSKVSANKIIGTGYEFQFEDLKSALSNLFTD